MSDLLAGSIAGAGLLLLIVLVWLWRRRRRRSTVDTALAAIAFERLRDVLLPDGMGGEIHIEHLLLTARGILVVNVKPYEGIIFASDRMDQWTVIAASGRATFPNPLSSLYDRVAAVRQLVRDIDVTGFVVFPALADFSKGRPADVRLPADLLADYAKSDHEDRGPLVDALVPHWEKLREAAQPASS